MTITKVNQLNPEAQKVIHEIIAQAIMRKSQRGEKRNPRPRWLDLQSD